MKLYSYQADQYITNLNLNVGLAALVYGPDIGAVQDYKLKFIKKIGLNKEQFGIVELSADQIKHDKSFLYEQANSNNLFNDKKLIIIDGINSVVTEIVSELINNISPSLNLIVLADELGKDSKLRQIFENHKSHMAIACYKDDIKTLKNLIVTKFRESNIKLDNTLLDFLCQNLGQDRKITINEIEKILIYLDGQKTLTIEDVTALLADNSEFIISDISYNLSLRNSVTLDRLLDKALVEQISLIAIIRNCISHFQKIAMTLNNIQNGQSLENSIKALRPPIFFKQIDHFRASVKKWNIKQIDNILYKLNEIEFSLKLGQLDSNLISHHKLLELVY